MFGRDKENFTRRLPLQRGRVDATQAPQTSVTEAPSAYATDAPVPAFVAPVTQAPPLHSRSPLSSQSDEGSGVAAAATAATRTPARILRLANREGLQLEGSFSAPSGTPAGTVPTVAGTLATTADSDHGDRPTLVHAAAPSLAPATVPPTMSQQMQQQQHGALGAADSEDVTAALQATTSSPVATAEEPRNQEHAAAWSAPESSESAEAAAEAAAAAANVDPQVANLAGFAPVMTPPTVVPPVPAGPTADSATSHGTNLAPAMRAAGVAGVPAAALPMPPAQTHAPLVPPGEPVAYDGFGVPCITRQIDVDTGRVRHIFMTEDVTLSASQEDIMTSLVESSCLEMRAGGSSEWQYNCPKHTRFDKRSQEMRAGGSRLGFWHIWLVTLPGGW